MTEVVFVHERYPFGGGETVTALVAKGITDAATDVHVTVIASELDRSQVEDTTGVSHIEAPLTAESIVAQLREIAEQGVLVVPVDPPKGMLASVRSELPGWRIVFILHSEPMWQVRGKTALSSVKALRERLFKAYTRRYTRRYCEIYSQVDRFCVLCDGYREPLARIVGDDSKIVAMHNPVEVTPVDVKPDGSGHNRTVLYVGRLDKIQKHVDRLLRAWAMVASSHPGWRLRIVGDGSDRDRLEALAASLDITGSVEFCGYTPDPAPYYACADIVAMTSEYEGWPCTLMEAMAWGVVSVAMDCCAGVHEILSDGRGVLVPPGDEVMFARELAVLMDDSVGREAMRPAMKAFATRFTPEKVAQNWLRLIKGIYN